MSRFSFWVRFGSCSHKVTKSVPRGQTMMDETGIDEDTERFILPPQDPSSSEEEEDEEEELEIPPMMQNTESAVHSLLGLSSHATADVVEEPVPAIDPSIHLAQRIYSFIKTKASMKNTTVYFLYVCNKTATSSRISPCLYLMLERGLPQSRTNIDLVTDTSHSVAC